MLRVQETWEIRFEVFGFSRGGRGQPQFREAASRRLFRGGKSLHILEGRGEDSRREFKCENKVSEKTQGDKLGNGRSCLHSGILKLRNIHRGKTCRREHHGESVSPDRSS